MSDETWNCGDLGDDGEAEYHLSAVLDGTPDGFKAFAQEYYERELGPEVDHAYELGSIDSSFISQLNPNADAATTLAELNRMGYPVNSFGTGAADQ